MFVSVYHYKRICQIVACMQRVAVFQAVNQ